MNGLLVLGAGVMGSALAATALRSDRGPVTLVGSPLDDDIIEALRAGRPHPGLDLRLPAGLTLLRDDEADTAIAGATGLVLGVSSAGMDWAQDRLRDTGAVPALLALVTKGLVETGGTDRAPMTYAEHLPVMLGVESPVIGIGGPCIARELALGLPTRVCFASRDRAHAAALRERVETAFYSATLSDDPVGLEACAALKNFLCIGVSAWLSHHRVDGAEAKNPVAALFNQAVLEMACLVDWIRDAAVSATGDPPTHRPLPGVAFDLPGLGDLHVTVGGGRNSRLGRHLGEGRTLSETLEGPMAGVTVEGVDTARVLGPPLRAACAAGTLDAAGLPLSLAVLEAVEQGGTFDLDLARLPR